MRNVRDRASCLKISGICAARGMAVTPGTIKTRLDLGGKVLPELAERLSHKIVCACLESAHNVLVLLRMAAHHDNGKQVHVVLTAAGVFLTQLPQECHAGLDARTNRKLLGLDLQIEENEAELAFIEQASARVKVRGRTYRAKVRFNGDSFTTGQSRTVKVVVPKAAYRNLRTKKSGSVTLVLRATAEVPGQSPVERNRNISNGLRR